MNSVLIFLGLTILALIAGYLALQRLPRSGLSPRTLRIVEWVCRIVLALVFVRAAIPKLIDPYGFATNIYAYRVISPFLATIGAVTMPAIELLASLVLIAGPLWRGGAVILGGFLIVFIAALFQAIVRGIDIHCGCFGKESHSVDFWLIAQDYGLLILALVPLVWYLRRHARRVAV